MLGKQFKILLCVLMVLALFAGTQANAHFPFDRNGDGLIQIDDVVKYLQDHATPKKELAPSHNQFDSHDIRKLTGQISPGSAELEAEAGMAVVKGKVTAQSTGNPIEGALVYVENTGPLVSTTTDQNGEYTLNVPASMYVVVAATHLLYNPQTTPEFHAFAGEVYSGTDFELSYDLGEVGTVTGYVYDEQNNPLEMAEVSLQLNDLVVGTTSTEEDGLYEILNVPVDEYTLTVSKLAYRPYTGNIFVTQGANWHNVTLTQLSEEEALAIIQGYALNGSAAELTLDELHAAGFTTTVEDNLPLYKRVIEAYANDWKDDTLDDLQPKLMVGMLEANEFAVINMPLYIAQQDGTPVDWTNVGIGTFTALGITGVNANNIDWLLGELQVRYNGYKHYNKSRIQTVLTIKPDASQSYFVEQSLVFGSPGSKTVEFQVQVANASGSPLGSISADRFRVSVDGAPSVPLTDSRFNVSEQGGGIYAVRFTGDADGTMYTMSNLSVMGVVIEEYFTIITPVSEDEMAALERIRTYVINGDVSGLTITELIDAGIPDITSAMLPLYKSAIERYMLLLQSGEDINLFKMNLLTAIKEANVYAPINLPIYAASQTGSPPDWNGVTAGTFHNYGFTRVRDANLTLVLDNLAAEAVYVSNYLTGDDIAYIVDRYTRPVPVYIEVDPVRASPGLPGTKEVEISFDVYSESEWPIVGFTPEDFTLTYQGTVYNLADETYFKDFYDWENGRYTVTFTGLADNAEYTFHNVMVSGVVFDEEFTFSTPEALTQSSVLAMIKLFASEGYAEELTILHLQVAGLVGLNELNLDVYREGIVNSNLYNFPDDQVKAQVQLLIDEANAVAPVLLRLYNSIDGVVDWTGITGATFSAMGLEGNIDSYLTEILDAIESRYEDEWDFYISLPEMEGIVNGFLPSPTASTLFEPQQLALGTKQVRISFKVMNGKGESMTGYTADDFSIRVEGTETTLADATYFSAFGEFTTGSYEVTFTGDQHDKFYSIVDLKVDGIIIENAVPVTTPPDTAL